MFICLERKTSIVIYITENVKFLELVVIIFIFFSVLYSNFLSKHHIKAFITLDLLLMISSNKSKLKVGLIGVPNSSKTMKNYLINTQQNFEIKEGR